MTEDEAIALVRECTRRGLAARLGVVGGTFDPIHRGHVLMGLAARDELGLDAVLFMPAGVPSFKRTARLAPAADRVAMARLAVAGLERCAVSRREVDRPGVTYTADTLRGLSAELPGAELVFVMGADSLETLPLWRDAATIARLATVAVAARAGHDLAPALARLAQRAPGFRVCRLERALPDVSSTGVRAAAARGEDLAPLVGAAVTGYIRSHGLYRDGGGPRREAIPRKGAC